jgi:sugar phosphate isomerase/epimerase
LEELEAYGSMISDIHIKDRMLGGPSVVLGEGNANFELFFKELKKYSYKGPFIMQAYRDEEGIDVFSKQLKWIKEIMKKVNYV